LNRYRVEVDWGDKLQTGTTFDNRPEILAGDGVIFVDGERDGLQYAAFLPIHRVDAVFLEELPEEGE
jgi:hypothetical protein